VRGIGRRRQKSGQDPHAQVCNDGREIGKHRAQSKLLAHHAILRVDKESPEKQGLKEPTASRSKKNLQPSAQDVKPASLKCRFHDLRHTAVTRLLEAGIPYSVVASMMGWSAATAIRKAKRQALRDAADVLGRTKILVGSLNKSPTSPEVSNVSVQ
jgi:integrase